MAGFSGDREAADKPPLYAKGEAGENALKAGFSGRRTGFEEQVRCASMPGAEAPDISLI